MEQTHGAHSEGGKRLQSADLNQNHADIYCRGQIGIQREFHTKMLKLYLIKSFLASC